MTSPILHSGTETVVREGRDHGGGACERRRWQTKLAPKAECGEDAGAHPSSIHRASQCSHNKIAFKKNHLGLRSRVDVETAEVHPLCGRERPTVF
jgi:hypothetical protein